MALTPGLLAASSAHRPFGKRQLRLVRDFRSRLIWWSFLAGADQLFHLARRRRTQFDDSLVSRKGGVHWGIVARSSRHAINVVDPPAYLADVLSRLINGWPMRQIDELIPWVYFWRASGLDLLSYRTHSPRAPGRGE
jgi:hypothetical protein